ncbi:MAG: endonuclease [Porticoccaceae bacterium]
MKASISFKLATVCIVGFISLPAFASGWSDTKNTADDDVYFDHRVTFYCGCDYVSDGDRDGSGHPMLDTCGYTGPSTHSSRAKQIEWEHVVPASLMPARQFECWTKGSRSDCERDDPQAQAMIFDLHNLVPSIGQVNALRLNDRYGEIAGEERKFGACEVEDSKGIFEPRDSERGDVARIWLYMAERHGVELAPGEREMFIRWHEADPVSDWEVERDKRIEKLQGTSNHWVR